MTRPDRHPRVSPYHLPRAYRTVLTASPRSDYPAAAALSRLLPPISQATRPAYREPPHADLRPDVRIEDGYGLLALLGSMAQVDQ